MNILDCENRDTIYKSIEKLFNISHSTLTSFLEDFNLEDYQNIHPESKDKYFLDLILEIFCNNFGKPGQIEETMWFHLTRVFNKDTFKKGIRPLKLIIDEIWQDLYSIIKDDISYNDWHQFREKMETDFESHYADLYRSKTMDLKSGGPFGVLNKLIAFNLTKIYYHDYLRVPEIIEDIAIYLNEYCNYDLMDKYLKNTKPCIVQGNDNSPHI